LRQPFLGVEESNGKLSQLPRTKFDETSCLMETLRVSHQNKHDLLVIFS
jgi:hypothetical protein